MGPLLEPRRTRTFSEASIRVNNNSKRQLLHGPLRVVRLCLLSIIFPGILVGVPLYMRYYVYGEQVYPVGMSDMRLLDHRVSTTWCQSQTVWSNATFNAYLMRTQPQLEREHEYVSMTRDLNNLEDDMKEYWGFYLLKGSVITVSTCARYPGASLILIQGHKHLRDCAYIGDDSSEELDELYPDDKNLTDVRQDPPNNPAQMTKKTDGVVIHGQLKNQNDSKGLPSYHKMASKSLSDSISDSYKSKKITKIDLKAGSRIHLAYAEFGNKLAKHHLDMGKLKTNQSNKENVNIKRRKSSLNDIAQEQTTTSTPTTTQKYVVHSSSEEYEDILKRLRDLGDKRGKRILERLNKSLRNSTEVSNTNVNPTTSSNFTESAFNKTKNSSKAETTKHKVRHNKKLLRNHKKNNKNNTANSELQRDKREILLNHLNSPVNESGEDTAMETEIHQPDDIAEIRGSVNETTANDRSNSEYWSSFSSSEERLLNCEGLLLNLPLKSDTKCNANLTEHHHNDDVLGSNIVTYKVRKNGYYFFVFNSENEVKPNFLRIHFRLEKTKYNVSDPVAACKNQTSACSLPLTFWSEQKVVLQLPVKQNDALWNQEFLAISTCEPRTSIYIACVIAVPLFIILFAFQ